MEGNTSDDDSQLSFEVKLAINTVIDPEYEVLSYHRHLERVFYCVEKSQTPCEALLGCSQ